MTIIVESGLGDNAAANSYGDVDSLRDYATLRGEDLTALSDAECEPLLIKAMDYIEAKRDRFKGDKANASQPLQWPRSDVWVDDSLLSSDSIPRELEYAQYALALIAKDHDLQPNILPDQQGAIIRERVEGVVEVEYSQNNQASFVPAFAKPEALLKPLYKNEGLRLIR
jgi:hypothetical protein